MLLLSLVPPRNEEPGGKRPESRTRTPARRALRLLRAAGVAGLSCEAFYLLAMNVFLSTPLFGKAINATPDIVDIHYERGWSLFPTRIHAQGLSIRATDSHVEWILRFDTIDFDCSLLELARQRFHVTRARGNGITFRARLKVASPAATPEHVAELPPIDSLGPVAFLPSEPPSPALWNDKAWHLWTVQIDDAIAEHVREVWIENGRFRGDARIAGGFLLKPMRAAYVGPAHVDFRQGRVEIDARTVAEPLVASLDFELARFDPRVAASSDLFPRISLAVEARTAVPDLDDLALPFPDSGQLRGRLEIPRLALRIEKGILRDGSHLDARGARVLFTTSAHVVSGAVGLAADVAGGKLAAAVTLEGVDADFALAIPRVTLTADSAALALVDPFADLHGVLDVPEASLPEAAHLGGDLKGAPVAIAGGSLRASLHAEGWRAENRVRGNAVVQGEKLDVRAGKLRARGDATVEASVGSLRFDTRAATDVRLAVRVDGLAAPRAFPGEPFLRVSGLRLHAEAADVDLDHPLRSLSASFALPDAELFDRDSARALLGLPTTVRLASGRARVVASAAVVLDGDHGKASLDASAPGVGLEYGRRRVGLDLVVHARASSADWERRAFSLDQARVVATRVVVSDASSPSALSVAHLQLAAATPRLNLADPLADLELIGAVGDGRMNTPSALGDLLPEGTTIALASKSGATFDGDFAARIVRHVARGAASLHVHGIGVSGEKLRIAGAVEASASVARWDLRQGSVDGEVRLHAGDVTGGFDRRPGPPDFVADRVDLHASAVGLDLAHPSMRGVDYGLHVGQAELGDARALNAFLPSPAILAIESGRALVSADLSTSGPTRVARGRIDVALAHGGIRLHETHLVGDFSLAVQAHSFDPEHAAVDLEGSWLAMRDVRVTGASTDTSAWSGDLVLQSGTLALAPTPTLEGDLTLEARDASPILGVLFRDSLPRFVAEMTRMPRFTAVTHVKVEPETLEVSDLSASGGDLSLRGTYVVRSGDRAAAFVVQKGPWSAGVNLDNHGPHLRLFGLDGWYHDHARQALAPTPP